MPKFVDRMKNEPSEPRISSCDISAMYIGIKVKVAPAEKPARNRPRKSHAADGLKITMHHQI